MTGLSVGRGRVWRRRVKRPASTFVNFVCFVNSVFQKLKSTLMRISRPVRIEFGWSHGPLGVKLLL